MVTALQGHERLRSALRVAVALCGLLIYAADASEHPARRPFAFGVLLAFLAWAVLLYAAGLRRSRHLAPTTAAWIDVGWVTLLVAVSEGTSGIFFPLYLFPILHASFGLGFRAGIVLTLGAAASFALVGAVTAPRGAGLDLNAFVARPLYLLLLGYLIAVWGEHEVRTRRRLSLLRDVTSLSNPRFGIDRTVARFLEAVRGFYDADACRLVVEQQDGERWLRTASRGAPARGDQSGVPPDLARVLLPDLPGAAIHVPRAAAADPLVDLEPGDAAATVAQRDAAAALLRALDARAVLSIPFRYHATAVGRLHVSRGRGPAFGREEIGFARHLLDQVVPVLENIRLVDRLASDAAEEERRRIARDLHDSVIQPYLGLRLGLSAAQKAFAAGRTEEGGAHVARLVALADGEIDTLRGYVRALRDGEPAAGGGLLDAGLRRFCRRFSEATGIRVEVRTEGGAIRNDRLAAEVFQMVAEALSNVRRHTSAGAASVSIRAGEAQVEVRVVNDGAEGDAPFFPRSIGERAAALGGSVRIEHPGAGTTAVRIEVPL